MGSISNFFIRKTVKQTRLSFQHRPAIIAIITLLFLSVLSTNALAQLAGLKIGYTDHERIIAAMPEFQQVQQTLQAETQREQNLLQAKYEDYETKLDNYQKQQALLSAERRKERENELIQLQQEIQRTEGTSQEKLAKRQSDLYAPIFEKVDQAIQATAKEKSIDIVLRSNIGAAQPIILYVNQDKIVDITLDIARKLGLNVTGTE
ncbi:MAG: OmpH family outer membrane protein [Calditrichaeota bacterium]|nr:MAG: OmpH family outer membrane protein [Calditrichota bacterium]MBL1206461.1 OmpH family outer membrane protein [Calditrichota bacterium]NOG46288.1 OmpH family outer membrane protein [Calditrichota bacterium]